MNAAARILAALAAATDGWLSQVELRSAADLSRSSVSSTLAKLVAAGEVIRTEQSGEGVVGRPVLQYSLPTIVEEIVAIPVTVDQIAELAAAIAAPATDAEVLAAVPAAVAAGEWTVVDDAFLADLAADIAATPAGEGACDDCYAEAGDPCQPYCSRSTIAPVAPVAPAKRATITAGAPARVLAALAASDHPMSRVELATQLGFCRNIATRALEALIASGDVVRVEGPGRAALHAVRVDARELVEVG